MVLKEISPRSGCWHDWVLVKVLFWVANCQLLIVSDVWNAEKGSKFSHDSYKGTNPIHEGGALMNGALHWQEVVSCLQDKTVGLNGLRLQAGPGLHFFFLFILLCWSLRLTTAVS